ncbi:DNA recombination protein RmuC [Candidatus Dojkabacteria bacterium]|uniref:DNA recombination protein RmuC n=1 Tax=Candidatus Dojkabacteria bacterium TaxID=2099670 RepID=A0A955KUU1_9BACT|nr:DNA recombination protein RmuC [Candidatus Dojkabacteria bacterium]
MEIVIGVVAGIIVSGVVFVLLRKVLFQGQESASEAAAKAMELQMRSLMPQLLEDAEKRLVSMANEKLSAEKKEIKTDVENKRSEISRMIKRIEEELSKSQEKLVASDKDRIGSFNELKTRLDEQKKLTEQLRVTTNSLKSVLSDNQIRGQFGEKVTEDLLKMSGFVKGVDYNVQETTGSSARPDFTVLLPDQTKIFVDSKFPYANLQKMSEVDDEEQKKQYMKLFEKDVKEKIKQVAKRDYIDPNENTVDFVILFIPNEIIFSFIYDKMNSVWQEAMANKVILAGPFSFTAILRMVKQAYDNFRYQANIGKMILEIKNFNNEFDKFAESFQKVGERIASLEKQYNTVENTRMGQLKKRIEKVRILDEGVQEEQPPLLENPD